MLEDVELVLYIRKKFHRPLRVCGMVRNTGEPGGGPFLNQLLRTTFTDINTDTELTKKQITPDFEYSYFSGHHVGNVTKTIYHLMFDFSGNVGL
jgi:hypothetical protein